MHAIDSVWAVFFVGLGAAMSPGPDFFIVTRMSTKYSRTVGLMTVLGVIAGNLIWVIGSLCGVAILLANAVIAFTVLKALGVCYLVWVGGHMLFSKKSTVTADERVVEQIPLRQAFNIGFFANATNPKCALFFVSFFSVMISPSATTWTQSLYGIMLMTAALLWFSTWACIASIGVVRDFVSRFFQWIDRAIGAVLVGIGFKLALSRE